MDLNSYKKAVIHNFRQIRESKGLSTYALAKILGVSQAKISYIENGKGVLSAAEVALLSRKLNVPVSEFFRGLEPSSEDAGVDLLVHNLVHYGAVLLAKPPGLLLETLSFEETFDRCIGFLEDARLHQGFAAALIRQAATHEIHVDQLFALIGNSPFLVNRTLEEAELASRILALLPQISGFQSKRAKNQLERIAQKAKTLLKTAGWEKKPTRLSELHEDEIPELAKFVEDCLNAKV